MTNEKAALVAIDINDEKDLPDQLTVREGRIVFKDTGETPLLPIMEGQDITVIPRSDAGRLINMCKEYKALVNRMEEENQSQLGFNI